MKVRLFLCVGLLFIASVPAQARRKQYDLSLEVVNYSVKTYVVGTIPAQPSQTTCTSTLNGGEVKTDCTTTPESPPRDRENYTVFLDAKLDGEHRDIRCTASW